MGGTEPVGPGDQPDAEVGTPPRLAVIMGRPADASRVCRVDAPDRVLRIWAMLASADGELHQASLRPGEVARLQRQLDALTAELERSLSPALAAELHRLVGREAVRRTHGGRAARRVREPAVLDDRPGNRNPHRARGCQHENPPGGLSFAARDEQVTATAV